MRPATRRWPADLSADQRVLYLSLRREAVAPTVRLRVWALGLLLALASGVGFVCGVVASLRLRPPLW